MPLNLNERLAQNSRELSFIRQDGVEAVQLTSEELDELSKFLKTNGTVKRLEITCGYTPDAEELKVLMLALHHLFIGPAGMLDLSKMLENTVSLTEFSLHNCALNDHAARLFSTALIENKNTVLRVR